MINERQSADLHSVTIFSTKNISRVLFFFAVVENWGGECDEGRRQSPIDLSYAASVRGYYPEFDFSDYDHVIPNANVSNNGHSSGWKRKRPRGSV